ncbi:hypothetical protein N0V84_012190 [Fusarium piperis]|uniref:Xylanolytic transcriptional activator regulatory domain-containing protein n=1 Tax=Fusarium piperis TaxID=1435070 RepID=A0A9W8W3R3_9HYPO|nr:hypothetical protein N0V84_012190 [Fusarium piperis]
MARYHCSSFKPFFSHLLTCTREARSALYRRAKLLFDFDAEISSVAKSQAALLLASWSFPGSSVSHKPSVPWLSIAIEHAKNAEAHRYQELGIAPCDQAILKRLWWCCVIRDRVLSLVARRGIQIDRGQFDFDFKAPLGLFDLADEFHRSKVHDLSTKVDLAKIFELLVELCIVLTDILQLAFPIEDKLSRGKLHIAAWKGVRECRLALHKWHQRAVSRLARFASPSSAVSDGHEYHDSVILYTNLLRMYY